MLPPAPLRFTDNLVIAFKEKLDTCTLSGLEMVYTALPMLGSGFRLSEVVTSAANRCVSMYSCTCSR